MSKILPLLVLVFTAAAQQCTPGLDVECPCPANCLTCSGTSACTKCDSEYLLLPDGSCTFSSDPSSQRASLIIIGSLCSVVGLGLISCAVYALFFRTKNSNRATVDPDAISATQDRFKPNEIDQFMKDQSTKYDSAIDHCNICLLNGVDLVTFCKHYFHESCFMEWYLPNKTCPNCREMVPAAKTLCKTCDVFSLPRNFIFENKQRKMLVCGVCHPVSTQQVVPQEPTTQQKI